jgi:hypothetical protein
MQKKTLAYIEDYIEILSGYVGIRGKNMTFNLARYDVQIVSSLADQTNRGVGYTDKQAILAHKLVVKYKKQFAKYDLDIGIHEENGHYRIPVRIVDRGRTIKLSNGQIQMKFPYETKMIDDIKENGKTVHGNIQFDREQKHWTMSITEPRLIWLESIADKYEFEMDDSLRDLIAQIKQVKTESFQIVLEKVNNNLIIRNAEHTLVDYINQQLGGFHESNLLKLVDYSGILGYSISKDLEEVLKNLHNENRYMLLCQKDTHIPLSDENSVKDIVEYAVATERWPIYVFENIDINTGRILPILKEFFTNDELLEVSLKSRKLDVLNKKCVYLNHWSTSWTERIPLLVTMTSLMIGPKKQHILQYSDKVVYCAHFMMKYNKPAI